MLTRFLIVILAILNVGVALWWMLPRAEPAVEPVRAEPGVASLEVLPSPTTAAPVAPATTVVPEQAPALATAAAVPPTAEPAKPAAPAAAEPKPAEPVPAAAAVPTPAVAEQCASFGPFAAQAQAQAALSALAGAVVRSRLREVPGKPASSYRVFIPPAASREEAQATAKRIVEAGFNDYFIVSQGEEANAVALGQYRNREGAERRLAALTAAGFPAKLGSNGGEGAAVWWLDVASKDAAGLATAKQRSAAAQQQSLDCARLR
ncbi:SPOR domain-containing protein [Stenotrophomonas sp. UBA7606]|uniref:SPOR domain-containing protein n=1 Tax=Stenotrophomonas sp. UBA7606 TaxID=1947559 RepID=UPI0025E2C826|nr:SPOR domain-containing protein [Stenotrophomonas sp. UBA7606]